MEATEPGHWDLTKWALLPVGSCVCWTPTMCSTLSCGFRKGQSWLSVAEPITFPNLFLPFWSSRPPPRPNLEPWLRSLQGKSYTQKESLLGKDFSLWKKEKWEKRLSSYFVMWLPEAVWLAAILPLWGDQADTKDGRMGKWKAVSPWWLHHTELTNSRPGDILRLLDM